VAFPGPSIGPWHIADLDFYHINEIFRQIEEQIKLLRGLGPTTVSSSGVVTSGTIAIGPHSHKTATTGGKISHDDALTGISADDHHAESHSHDVGSAAGGLPNAVDFEDAQPTASHISDQVFGGTGVTVTELADGSGDAVAIAIDTSTFVTTTNTDWVDLTDGGTTTLHLHAGGSTENTDVSSIDANDSASRIVDQVLVGSGLTLTELAEGSGDAIQLAVDSTVITTANTDWIDLTDGGATTLHSHAGTTAETDQALYGGHETATRLQDELFVDANLTLTEFDESGTVTLGVNTATVITTAHTDWVDLTDGGATTLHSHAGGAAEATDVGLVEGSETASHISDEILVGSGLTLTELADGSGDAIQLAVDSTVVLTTSTDWVDLTDGGATALHSHAGSSEATDVGLSEGIQNERITDLVHAGNCIGFMESDESGAIQVNTTLAFPFADTVNAFGTATNAAGDFTTGQLVFMMGNATLLGLKFAYNGFASKTVKLTVWDRGVNETGGTIIATGSTTADAVTTYTVLFTTPVLLKAFNLYVFGIYVTDGTNFLSMTGQPYGWKLANTVRNQVPIGPVMYYELAAFVAGDGMPVTNSGTNIAVIQLLLG
jgi:hypothetical protein